ncbi:MAG: nucleotidyltransferase domain-containing protein [Thermodesulfovibrionales bacterium]|nr:nucleotidyltransferase domain-containing protein [Thermodesulfovibrionales bacterium]
MSLLSLLKERQAIYRSKAISESKKIVRLLREKYSFDEVFICGSLLKDNFNRHSDIDIVIKGLSADSFFKAYSLMIINSSFTIDLKPFEDLTDDFKEYVLTKGVKIG